VATAADADLAASRVQHARREGQTIITLDADFHALLALSNAASPSVVRIRLRGGSGAYVAPMWHRSSSAFSQLASRICTLARW